MSKKLIIVESPTKAKTIGKFLNDDYIIKASMGHIRDLPEKELGVDIENGFKPNYIIDKGKTKIINDLKESAKKAETILLASDHDREGEAIAWHLAYVLRNEIKEKKLNRIVFNEITKNAIIDALKEPGIIDQNKVDAQQARRILDRIVGYKISPVLWKVIAKSLSAGRVQSVALRLICEREQEINEFLPQEYWTIEAVLYREGLKPFTTVLSKWNRDKKDVKTEAESQEIVKALQNSGYLLSDIEKKKRNIEPNPPYITSTIQQDASRLLGFATKKTMMLAQQLYEGIEINGSMTGLISYMRTDSLRVSELAVESCRNLIGQRFGKTEINKNIRTFENKNRAQDAHEAIRPTDAFRTPESIKDFLNKDQLKLYTLIWQRFVATQMNPVELSSVTLTIEAGAAEFKATGSVINNPGFTKVYPHVAISLGEEIDPGYSEKDLLICQKIEGLQHFTKPPSRFSEASLIKELESKGIGRPSTYSSIVNTLTERKYAVIKEKRFFPTELGTAVNTFLVASFDSLFNVTFTADMENQLDEIEYGNVKWKNLLEDYYKKISQLIENTDTKSAKKENIETTDIACELCGHKMQVKWSKRGQFLACSNYPTCKNAKEFIRNETGKIEIKEEEKLNEMCPVCGKELTVKKGRFGKFIACTGYPKCKFTRPFTLGIKCPDCGKGELVEKKTKKGKSFYGCSNYPDCKFITNKKPVAMSCPECKHPYVEQTKEQGELKCPKCGTVLHV